MSKAVSDSGLAQFPQRADGARAEDTADFAEVWRPEDASEAPRGPAAILLAEGKITPEQFEHAVGRQKENPRLTVLDALVEAKVIDELMVLRAIATYFKLPFASVKPDEIEAVAFKQLPVDFIRAKNVLPIRFDDGRLVIGIADPADIFLIDDLKRRIRHPVQLVVTPPADIIRVADELGGSSMGGMDEIIQGIQEDDIEVVAAKAEEVNDLEKIAGESPVIRYVNYVVTRAVQEGASDIHIEPGENRLRIRYRVDGILFDQPAPPLPMHAAIVSRLKIMANMDIAERRLPQDGRVRAMIHGRHVDLRVSTLPITHGEKCVIRILDNRSILLGMEKLGMLPDMLEAFQRQIDQPHGIVLVTGPTGSGKTTTLYSALRVMDGDTMNISTVEDPVEYELEFANQVNVRDAIGMTFSAALRSLLRQDPDVIMVGEIRDAETARIAVQASLTGHMVLSTLHTNDAPSTITRLINIGIEPYLISASVNAVLAQRLVRKICSGCKEVESPVRESVARYLARCKAEIGTVYRGAGCDKCRHTGYSGRVGIYEMVEIDDAMRDMITSNPSVTEMRRFCREHGMRTLREDGLMKVAAGMTTTEEIARATET